jgi:16S rRNA processing protein RimM
MAPEDLLLVGRIAKAHGVRGEVSVEPLSEVEGRFAPGSTLLAGEAGDRTLTVAAVRPHTARLLVRFEGVDGRDAAEALRGTLLFVRSDETPDLPEGSYWPHDLVGCEVVTEDGRSLGPLTEVLTGPANDLWVTGAGMIPAVREFVVEVDLATRRIVVRTPPGLLEEG